jgi:hypothetical protein
MHRRHLDAGQRATIANRARKYFDRRAKKRQKEHGGTAPSKPKENTCGKIATSDSTRARDEAGQAFGVSGNKEAGRRGNVRSSAAGPQGILGTGNWKPVRG